LRPRAIALIDGEHYAPVVRDALAELPYEFAAAYVVGGTEKLRPGGEYGVPLCDELEAAIRELEPAVVVDLSDEPVLGPRRRFRLASLVLACGVPYEGADFRLEPPAFEPFELPSLAVLGTGKRVGKTAVAAHVARKLSERRDVVVVAMGRGGPEKPAVVDTPPTIESLLELARAGGHAASDYLELAALTGLVTIGCRRCGGGLAGAVATSNVSAGLELARERRPDLVLFDASGAAVPPVAVGKRLLVADVSQDPALVTGYLNAYRILLSDLVVLTMAGEGTPHEDLARAVSDVKDVPVVAAALRPRPVRPLDGRRVAYFTTAADEAHDGLARHLRERHGVDVACVSGSLSRRAELARELERADAEVYLVELKAAAIDVVAQTAVERGIEVVFADNEVVPLPGQPDLDAELEALAEASAREPVRS
jgi:cyclic 2,3-diphosphoglycerate synthase